MNLETRGTSRNDSIRATKSKINKLRKKLKNEIKKYKSQDYVKNN